MKVERSKCFCFCRSIESEEDNNNIWIGCDYCEEWYHPSCVGINEKLLNNIKCYRCFRCSIDNGVEYKYLVNLIDIKYSLRYPKLSTIAQHLKSGLELRVNFDILQKLNNIYDQICRFQLENENFINSNSQFSPKYLVKLISQGIPSFFLK